ncbi:MAG: FAD:protein FMN transferase [Burkholderiales bacterium]
MGTLLHVAARGGDGDVVARAIDDALEAVARVERLMSFHDETSELTRLNREGHRTPQVVDPWTYAVLIRAQRVARASDGLFDVTVAPILVDRGELPRHAERNGVGGCWRDVELRPGYRVFFRRPLWMDLGGIAKGFAVDQAILSLRRSGCLEASVNAGGDLRRYGETAEVIHLRSPAGLMPVAELGAGAVATSAARVNYDDRLAQPIGCIVDPRRGAPWPGRGSVMVAARTCVMADALTKVAALAGPSCEALLARFGAAARWFDAD